MNVADRVKGCENKPVTKTVFQHVFCADLISRMNLTEKISQLGTNAGAVVRLTIPAYQW